MADDKPPVEEDIRTDDAEFNPAMEPRKSRAWLNLLIESEKAFESWNHHCDNIDKQYASLERLANMSREREFAMFWANCEVLKPSIYARAPVPVVVPKFKDRRPVYQEASEVMERCAIVSFDLTYINDVMLQLRDDLALSGRGVAWCRYESGGGDGYYNKSERVCVDYKHRRDFLHSISRCWYEVTWVAAASYLTRSEARDRFEPHSGDSYQEAEYRVDKDAQSIGGADNRERAKFWEIWDKTSRRVVWVAEGCEDILDEDDPHLDLDCYFPCPQPVYGTTQRGSLVPVPDMMQYRDQLEEVNMLTGRIHALSDALEAKGFYPAGGAEISDAVQSAVKMKTPGRLLVPISNWAAFGGSKEVIVWLPIDMIAECITQLVALRKQVIDDIYQIMGLSDIMRGTTNPTETLGAQELKTQYGSTRVRDKQYAMARIARDLVAITSEIITEKFKATTIIEMSQTQLPTQAMQQKQLRDLGQQVQRAQMMLQQLQQSPQAQSVQQPGMPPGPPDQLSQQMQQVQMALQQAQSQYQKVQAQPTIEQVLTFLKNNRAKSFVLDIETDSTIIPDENASKQQHTEFLAMLSPVLQQLMEMVAAEPGTASFAGDILKFAVEPFRVGRSLDGSIDELVENAKAKAGQARGDDPATQQAKTALQIEQVKSARQAERDKADVALKAREIDLKDKQATAKIVSDHQLKLAELQQRQGETAIKAADAHRKALHETSVHQADVLGKAADIRLQQQQMAIDQASEIARQGEAAAQQAAQPYQQPKGFTP